MDVEFLVNGITIKFNKVRNRIITVNGCQKSLKSLVDGERWFPIPNSTKIER